ncbi:hypothetical protein F0U59_38580 [Archangium gephyra]|nr:hypothetical protein F0U59_38580 [Archangium gephyra]
MGLHQERGRAASRAEVRKRDRSLQSQVAWSWFDVEGRFQSGWVHAPIDKAHNEAVVALSHERSLRGWNGEMKRTPREWEAYIQSATSLEELAERLTAYDDAVDTAWAQRDEGWSARCATP